MWWSLVTLRPIAPTLALLLLRFNQALPLRRALLAFRLFSRCLPLTFSLRKAAIVGVNLLLLTQAFAAAISWVAIHFLLVEGFHQRITGDAGVSRLVVILAIRLFTS